MAGTSKTNRSNKPQSQKPTAALNRSDIEKQLKAGKAPKFITGREVKMYGLDEAELRRLGYTHYANPKDLQGGDFTPQRLAQLEQGHTFTAGYAPRDYSGTIQGVDLNQYLRNLQPGSGAPGIPMQSSALPTEPVAPGSPSWYAQQQQQRAQAQAGQQQPASAQTLSTTPPTDFISEWRNTQFEAQFGNPTLARSTLNPQGDKLPENASYWDYNGEPFYEGNWLERTWKKVQDSYLKGTSTANLPEQQQYTQDAGSPIETWWANTKVAWNNFKASNPSLLRNPVVGGVKAAATGAVELLNVPYQFASNIGSAYGMVQQKGTESTTSFLPKINYPENNQLRGAMHAIPLFPIYNMARFLTQSEADRLADLEDIEGAYHAGRVLMTGAFDITVREEFIRRVKAGENPEILAQQLANPWAELAGAVILDPLNLIGGSASKVGKVSNMFDDVLKVAPEVSGVVKLVGEGATTAKILEASEKATDVILTANKAMADKVGTFEKLGKWADKTGLTAIFEPTATARQWVLSQRAGTYIDWMYRTYKDNVFDAMQTLVDLSSNNRETVQLALTKLGDLPGWQTLLSNQGREAGHVLRELMGDNPQRLLDDLADVIKSAGDNADDAAKQAAVAEWATKKLDDAGEKLFPKMTTRIKNGENIPEFTKAIVKFHEAAQKGPVGMINRFFAGVYLGMSPAYAFRNALTNMTHYVTDYGFEGSMNWLKAEDQAAEWLGQVSRAIAGIGGGAMGADTGKPLLGFDARTLANWMEKKSAAMVVNTAAKRAMGKLLRPGRALPELRPLLDAGMPAPVANHLVDLIYRYKGDVNKAANEILKQAGKGSMGNMFTLSFLAPDDVSALKEFGIYEDVFTAIKNADGKSLNAALSELAKVRTKVVDNAVNAVADEMPTVPDNAAHAPDVAAARQMAEEGSLTEADVRRVTHYSNANHYAISEYRAALYQLLDPSNPLSQHPAVASIPPEIRTALFSDKYGEQIYRQKQQMLETAWRYTKLTNGTLQDEAFSFERVWNELGIPGIVPANAKDFKNALWERWYYPQTRAMFTQLRESTAQIVDYLYEATGAGSTVQLQKAQRHVELARIWDGVMRNDEVENALRIAISTGNTANANRVLAAKYGIATLRGNVYRPGANLDKQLLNIINRYLPEGQTAQFENLADIPPDIAEQAFQNRLHEMAWLRGNALQQPDLAKAKIDEARITELDELVRSTQAEIDELIAANTPGTDEHLMDVYESLAAAKRERSNLTPLAWLDEYLNGDPLKGADEFLKMVQAPPEEWLKIVESMDFETHSVVAKVRNMLESLETDGISRNTPAKLKDALLEANSKIQSDLATVVQGTTAKSATGEYSRLKGGSPDWYREAGNLSLTVNGKKLNKMASLEHAAMEIAAGLVQDPKKAHKVIAQQMLHHLVQTDYYKRLVGLDDDSLEMLGLLRRIESAPAELGDEAAGLMANALINKLQDVSKKFADEGEEVPEAFLRFYNKAETEIEQKYATVKQAAQAPGAGQPVRPKARPLAAEAGPVQSETVQAFAEAMQDAFKLSPEETDDVMRVTDAMASGWAADTGRSADEWYASRIGEVQKGGRVQKGALMQRTTEGAARGAVSFGEDLRAYIQGFKSADASTAVHEMAHVLRKDLFRRLEEISDPVQQSILRAELESAENYLGVTVRGQWERKHEEQFADAFERYLRDGLAPVPELQGLFTRIKNWMLRIYQNITGTRLEKEVSPELKRLFDRALATGPRDLPEYTRRAEQMAARAIPVEGGHLMQQVMAQSADGLEDLFLRVEDAVRTNWGKSAETGSGWEKTLGTWAKEAEGRVATARLMATNAAAEARKFTLLNYPEKTGLDLALSYIFPYQFWYNRSYANWMKRLVNNPVIIANYSRYREAMAQQHAGAPDWWKYNINTDELLGIDTGHPLFFNLEATLNPLNGLTGVDFNDPDKRVGWAGALLDDIGKFGPSIWTPINWAMALALKAKGEDDAAARWGGRLFPQTPAIKSAMTLMGAKFHLGKGLNEVDPAVLMFAGGLDPYERNRVGRNLAAMMWEGEVGEAEAIDAANNQSGPLWDAALERAIRERAGGNLAAFALGVGFRARNPSDIYIDRFYQDYRALNGTTATMSPEEVRDGYDTLRQKYPFMDTLLLSRLKGLDRDRGFGYNVLSRIPPGQRDDIAKAAGMDYSLIEKFYDAKGNLKAWPESDRMRFMAAMVDIAAVLDLPDQATKEQWYAASDAYKAMTKAMQQQFGSDILERIDAYYEIKRTDRAKASDYLEANPEIGAAMDFRAASVANDAAMAPYYGGLDVIERYYTSVMYDALEQQFGDMSEVWAAYDEAKLEGTQAAKAFKAAHPEIQGYYNLKASYQKEIAAAVRRAAGNLHDIPLNLRPDAQAQSLGSQGVLQTLNTPAEPSVYEFSGEQLLSLLPSVNLANLVLDSALTGEELPYAAQQQLEYALEDYGITPEQFVVLVQESGVGNEAYGYGR